MYGIVYLFNKQLQLSNCPRGLQAADRRGISSATMPLLPFAGGASAALVATVSTYPLDLLRTIMAAQASCPALPSQLQPSPPFNGTINGTILVQFWYNCWHNVWHYLWRNLFYLPGSDPAAPPRPALPWPPAERDSTVERLFMTDLEQPACGLYVVRLCLQGHWHQILVSDEIPCYPDSTLDEEARPAGRPPGRLSA